jgi:Tfp pilus assembly protein PilV
MLPKKIKNQKGISLIEVLAVMLILVIGILGIAPMIIVSQFGNSWGKDVLFVNAESQKRMENFRNMPVDSLYPLIGQSTNTNGNFTFVTAIDTAHTGNSIPPGLVRIDLTANFTDFKGKSRTLSFATFRER